MPACAHMFLPTWRLQLFFCTDYELEFLIKHTIFVKKKSLLLLLVLYRNLAFLDGGRHSLWLGMLTSPDMDAIRLATANLTPSVAKDVFRELISLGRILRFILRFTV